MKATKKVTKVCEKVAAAQGETAPIAQQDMQKIPQTTRAKAASSMALEATLTSRTAMRAERAEVLIQVATMAAAPETAKI